MILKADFHIHSCLSPCGDLAMSPEAIVATLHQKGIALAALTDHNTALNCPSFAYACKKYGIAPLFGIEAQPFEEVHVLCLFAELDTALYFGEELYNAMPFIPNNPEKMGDQVYVDEDENIIGEVEKYLLVSADVALSELAARVIALGGLLIPAHVDRPAFSMTSQLGFIPDGPWTALEAVRIGVNGSLQDSKGRYIETHNLPLISSSDSHYLEHIARRPFLLDISDNNLYKDDKTVNIDAIRYGLTQKKV